MAETKESPKNLELIFQELAAEVQKLRQSSNGHSKTIKDFRWIFDQESGRMNQAIFNDQVDQVHESCLRTIAALVEILARS